MPRYYRALPLCACILLVWATAVRAEITVSTDFEGGSAKIVSVDQATKTIRIMPGGDPARGWPCWWYLRVDGLAAGDTLTLEVAASDAPLPPRGKAPSKLLAASWCQPGRATFSIDGKSWRHSEPGQSRDGRMSYAVAAEGKSLWLAWGPPFTPRDSGDLVAVAGRRQALGGTLRAMQIQRRPALSRLALQQGDLPDEKRLGIWIQARQHAWEWAEAGLAAACVRVARRRRSASPWPSARNARSCSCRSWTSTTRPPATAARRACRRTTIATGPTSPVPCRSGRRPEAAFALGGRESPGPVRRSAQPRPRRQAAFLLCQPRRPARRRWPPQSRPLLHHQPRRNHRPVWRSPTSSATSGPAYDPLWKQISKTLGRRPGPQFAVAVTLETSWNTPHSTTEGYRTVGRQLAQAIEKYLRDDPRK